MQSYHLEGTLKCSYHPHLPDVWMVFTTRQGTLIERRLRALVAGLILPFATSPSPSDFSAFLWTAPCTPLGPRGMQVPSWCLDSGLSPKPTRPLKLPRDDQEVQWE